MNLEPKPEEARGGKVGEMMPGRKSSIPNSSESSTSGSFFTSISTPATATTIDTTPPELSTEPRFCVEVDTSDTLWRLYGRSTDFPVQTVKPKRTRYVYHPAPPRTCFHEAKGAPARESRTWPRLVSPSKAVKKNLCTPLFWWKIGLRRTFWVL